MEKKTIEKEDSPHNSINNLQKQIRLSKFQNPKIIYNSNKSYALCTKKFKGSNLASRVDYFVYDLKKDSIIKKGSLIGNIFWEDDYTISLVPYKGIERANQIPTLKDLKTNKNTNKIYLTK